MRPRVRRRCWVFPTVLYDFRLCPEGPPYLPSLGRISFLLFSPVYDAERFLYPWWPGSWAEMGTARCMEKR